MANVDINYDEHEPGKVWRKRTRDFREVYKIKEILHRGHFSVIRRCYRREDRKNYAMKIVRRKRRKKKKNAEYNDVVANMIRQSGTLSKMNHRNICRNFDTYITPNYIHMVMELCNGKDLFEAIHDDATFSEEDAAKIIYQIADGIKHMHSHDIVHRDIKPENVLCQIRPPDNQVVLKDDKQQKPEVIPKIVSFGFSANFKEKGGCSSLIGTDEYVAPEVLNESTKYNEKVDMWSLGVLMYILLVGYFPFDYDHNTQSKKVLYTKIREGEVIYSHGWEEVSDGAKRLIKKLLRVSPSKRASAEEVMEDEWITNSKNTPLHNSTLKAFQKQIKFRRAISKLISAIKFKNILLECVEAKESGESEEVKESDGPTISIYSNYKELQSKSLEVKVDPNPQIVTIEESKERKDFELKNELENNTLANQASDDIAVTHE